MNNAHESIKVNVLRGHNIESLHEVSALVLNTAGKTEMSWGNTDIKIYPRSSIKPIQALSVILSGAADQFQISDIELALACASHSGEPEHVSAVSSWLSKIGLSKDDLECGSHIPSHQKSALQLMKSGGEFSSLHNNCSGKHTGMLSTCLALGFDTKGYVRDTHPLQQFIKNIIEDLASEKIGLTDIAIDGCSIPTYFMHMKNLALAMARFAHPTEEFEKYHEASRRLIKAITTNPYYLAGTDRYCTRMTKALNKSGFVKTGAEGVMFACLPEQKLGIVVKAHDGATRAAEISTSWILKELGVLNKSSWQEFSELPINNWNQIRTGSVVI